MVEATMTAFQHIEESDQRAARKTNWLPALEQELKSRVGWVDEAVSPFAVKRPRVQPAKVRRERLPADTTPQAA
jgi:hypothetical protein